MRLCAVAPPRRCGRSGRRAASRCSRAGPVRSRTSGRRGAAGHRPVPAARGWAGAGPPPGPGSGPPSGGRGRTAAPRGRVRAPSSAATARAPAISSRSAARPKFSSSATATKYRSWRSYPRLSRYVPWEAAYQAARTPVVAPVLVAGGRWSHANHGERCRRRRAGDHGTPERARAVRGAVRLRAAATGRRQRDRVDLPALREPGKGGARRPGVDHLARGAGSPGTPRPSRPSPALSCELPRRQPFDGRRNVIR